MPAEPLAQVVNGLSDGWILAHGQADPVHSVQDGRVVAIADAPADLGEAVTGELAGEVHGDLPGRRHVRAPIAIDQLARVDPEFLGGRVEDLADARDPERLVVTKPL